MVVQTAGQGTSSERLLLPDVAFVRATNNAAYEARRVSVVGSADMTSEQRVTWLTKHDDRATSNLAYETRRAPVVVSANMMSEDLLILSQPLPIHTPPKTDEGDSKLPPPPVFPTMEDDPTSQAREQIPRRPTITTPAASPVSPQPRKENHSRFKAPTSHDWRDPTSPFFAKMNKVRETIQQALRQQNYIKDFHKDDIPTKEHCPKTHAHLN